MPITATCPCGKVYSLPGNFAGQKATCKACGSVFLVPTELDPPGASAPEPAADGGAGGPLYDRHPAMFRNHPLPFVFGLVVPLAVLLVGLLRPNSGGLLALGAVLAALAGVAFLVWYLQCRATRLTITDRKVTLRRGLLTKDINEVRHEDIRNLRLSQGVLQRLLDVGSIGLSTAGQSGVEIEVHGLPHPHRVREIINGRRA
jgi:membrane protein YdbS with pleckstrin-like domain